ncbi:MAG: hypothetical protein GY759_12975 [Chloroflexi bacterium]|nr:hypothetical protein [Chloroflexota bacterium]
MTSTRPLTRTKVDGSKVAVGAVVGPGVGVGGDVGVGSVPLLGVTAGCCTCGDAHIRFVLAEAVASATNTTLPIEHRARQNKTAVIVLDLMTFTWSTCKRRKVAAKEEQKVEDDNYSDDQGS